MEKNASLLTFLILLVINPLIVYNQVNDYRASNELKPLMFDEKLCVVARVRAEQVQSDLSHNGFKQEIKKIKYKRIGENLAKNFSSETSMVRAWIKSEPHREILLKKYTKQCLVCNNNHCVLMLRG